MAKSQIPTNVQEAIARHSAASNLLGYYTAAVNFASADSSRSAYRIQAANAKHELDMAAKALVEAIEAYGSQLYEGGLELGRAEGAR